MDIQLRNARVRHFKKSDKASIAKYANNHKIWRNVRNAFPHPYTEADAEWWVNAAIEEAVPTKFAIEVDGQAIGGIGFIPQEDIHIKTVELGYWIGEEYWSKGIITSVLKAFSNYIFENFDIIRLEAHVYHWNIGSMKALEKAGFHKEAVLKKRAFKDGEYVDEHIFAKFKDEN
jgi:[ribosomal protein S5]-alanine N-acetyltransferase